MNDVNGHAADGHTLLTMSLPMTVTPSLLLNFDPVIKMSKSYTVLVTTPSLPAPLDHKCLLLVETIITQPTAVSVDVDLLQISSGN